VDTIAAEALSNLSTAVGALLPPAPDPALAPTVLVTPLRVAPTGLGGYAGPHADPQGEIYGRRVTARVTVSVPAEDASGLDAAVSQVTHSFMTTGRDELGALGILRLALAELGPRPAPAAPGPPETPRREVHFDVLFEFLKIPESAGGVIETIPLDIDPTIASDRPRRVLHGPFVAGALDLFDVVDDAAATTAAPSAWAHDPAEQAIVQTSAIRGGAESTAPNKPGTALVLRASPARLPFLNLSIASTVQSDVEGGLGFVFRFQDPGNFYYVLLDSRNGFRRMGRKVAGAFGALDEGGLDGGAGFPLGTPMRLRLLVQDDTFVLRLDGQIVLEGGDASLPAAGRVGFLTRNCTGARFYDCTLLRL
jgi:hypothetical protein